MAVIIAPTAKRLVQLLDQGQHRCADVVTDQFSYLPDEGENSLLSRCNVQYLAVLAEGLAEKSETVLYNHVGAGLLLPAP